MCLYSSIIRNKKYTATKKNGGIIPAIPDKRVMYTPIPCGECMECRAKKKRDWQCRLTEEIKSNRKIGKKGYWLTLTFSEESLAKLCNEIEILTGYELENAAVTLAMKRFRDRWRKNYKHSVRRWFITELGHKNTERIHLHGFIWSEHKEAIKMIRETWQYGHVWAGKQTSRGIVNYVTEKTINYTVKYVHKIDKDHKYYKPIVLCSPGIGEEYTKSHKAEDNIYKGEKTKDYYTTELGKKVKLPTYWRNKLFKEEEKEKLWIMLLDKKIRYIGGKEIDISKGEENYYKALEYYQAKNKRLGYGNGEINWERKKYENQRRQLIIEEREKQIREKHLGHEVLKKKNKIQSTRYVIPEDNEHVVSAQRGLHISKDWE